MTLRVFARPVINHTKKQHSSSCLSKSNKKSRVFFIWLGRNWHRLETKINRANLNIRTDKELFIQEISEEVAIGKGIETFYEILLYVILFALPIYEIIRSSRESSAKSNVLNDRLHSIKTEIHHETKEIKELSELINFQINSTSQMIGEISKKLENIEKKSKELGSSRRKIEDALRGLREEQAKTEKSAMELIRITEENVRSYAQLK